MLYIDEAGTAASVKRMNFHKPLSVRKCEGYIHAGLHEILAAGLPTGFYISFNGDSKQRRQQKRKLIHELNQ